MMDLNMKVLIVDDFATIRRIIKDILKQIGFKNIVEAENGESALEALTNSDFGLILSDWNMPEMKGIELLHRVRADARLKKIPFVMVTAEAKKNNILEAVKAGVSSYIVKPFTPETVAEKLEKVFGG